MLYKLMDTKGNEIEQTDMSPLDGKVGEQVTKKDGSVVYLLSVGEMTFERSGVLQAITVGTKEEADIAAAK